MRKFKNKKLASLLVVFLLVFIMSGAFALFQTILDVRGRVNMYAPAIDAMIANLTPVAAPLGVNLTGAPLGLATVPDPDSVHDANPPIGGPWLGQTDPPITTRFDDRIFGTSLGEDLDGVGSTLFDSFQTLDGRTRVGTVGMVPTSADLRAVSSWFWPWQAATDESNDTVLEGATAAIADDAEGLRPNPNRVTLGTIANPGDFRRLYLDLTFDNFNQFYVFELDLANVGGIDLEVTEIEIERVLEDFTGQPIASALAAFQYLEDGTEHPRWEELSVAIDTGLAGLFNLTVDASEADASSNGGILLLTPDPTATVSAGAASQVAIDEMRAARNTQYVTLRFCVALENWNAFLADWNVPEFADGWGASVLESGAFPAEITDVTEALDYLLGHLFNNALSSTFRITYTVIPYQEDIDRADTGVIMP